jgi:hypothetical protein
MGTAVCGPNALKSGVANAVASLQRLVVQGEVQSIALDSETFGKALASIFCHEAVLTKSCRLVT